MQTQHNDLILLVEDDENDAMLIQRAFHKAGVRKHFKLARTGDMAIAYLAGRGQYANRERFPVPFLLLLDLKLPGTNGFDLLRWVRSEPALKRLLVVVLTSSNRQEDVDRAYELGANSYLVKPVAFEEMVNMVSRFEAYWSEINRTPTSLGSTPAGHPEPVVK